MADWPQIFFARHGETDWNRERRYQGTMDIPLNKLGQGQADAIGPLLVDMLAANNVDPTNIDWYASPLSRASETMVRMRKAFDMELPEVRYDDRLKEISFGVMEGKLHSELEKDLGVPAGQRAGEYWGYRPPEGESYDDVTARMMSFASDLTGTSVIVAHGGILRAVRYLVENAPRAELVNWPPPQGAIAHFLGGEMNMHFADV